MTPANILKLIDPIKKRIMNILSRGVVNSVDDSKGIQRIKTALFADEIHDNVERFQNYGFTSKPLPGAESLALFHSGNREHGIIIVVDDRRYRLKGLADGEVAIFTDEGDKIHFKRGNKIEILTGELTVNASTKVIVNAPQVDVNSDVANVISPEVNVTSSTGVNLTTPLLSVSGLISCAGIGAGAPPAAGKAVIAGDVESSGQVKDSVGTMADIRTKYNGHKHNVPTDPIPTPQM